MTFNKIDGATALKKAGIPLPEDWGKLSTSRAEVFVTKALSLVTKDEPPKKVGIIAHGVSAIMGGLAAAGAAVVEAGRDIPGMDEPAPALDDSARRWAKAKVYSDPTYVRTTRASRRVNARYRLSYAADPVPMTRQGARRKALDVGLSASDFRSFMGAV